METNKKTKKKRTLYSLFFKRFFDILFSLLAIIILSPLLLIMWIILRINLKGKAVFAQYRPGKNGKIFKFYKFRSMTNATDEKGELLPDAQRITKIGKFIRKTSIDELPQLFNILKGDMSFIGPRPRLVKDMVFYDEETLEAYSVRPGLTGPSQVCGGRSSISWEEIFELDLKYANKITLFKDIGLLFKTVGAVFKSDSGSAGNSKREYYYADYLLKTNKITQEQYTMGLARAEQLIASGGKITYQPELHNPEPAKVEDEAPAKEEQTKE